MCVFDIMAFALGFLAKGVFENVFEGEENLGDSEDGEDIAI